MRYFAAVALAALAWPAPADLEPPSHVAAEVVTLANVERARKRLPPLAPDGRLMRAAQLHAEQMAQRGELGHVLRGVAHPRPEDRLKAAKYAWRGWAENVAYGQENAAEAMRSWMKSKGHRANILDPSLTDTGVGVAKDAEGRAYWVQVFGRPLS